jgi:hypothetical protein
MTSEPGPSPRLDCTLSPQGLRARKALIETLLSRGLEQLTPIRGGVRARFVPGVELEAELQALVRLEAECCTFLSLVLRSGDGDVVLEVTGRPGTQALIGELFPDPAGANGFLAG